MSPNSRWSGSRKSLSPWITMRGPSQSSSGWQSPWEMRDEGQLQGFLYQRRKMLLVPLWLTKSFLCWSPLCRSRAEICWGSSPAFFLLLLEWECWLRGTAHPTLTRLSKALPKGLSYHPKDAHGYLCWTNRFWVKISTKQNSLFQVLYLSLKHHDARPGIFGVEVKKNGFWERVSVIGMKRKLH